MKSLAVLVLGVIVTRLATTTLAAPDFASIQVIPYKPHKPAPGFSLPDLHDEVVHLSELRGKVAMLIDSLP